MMMSVPKLLRMAALRVVAGGNLRLSLMWRLNSLPIASPTFSHRTAYFSTTALGSKVTAANKATTPKTVSPPSSNEEERVDTGELQRKLLYDSKPSLTLRFGAHVASALTLFTGSISLFAVLRPEALALTISDFTTKAIGIATTTISAAPPIFLMEWKRGVIIKMETVEPDMVELTFLSTFMNKQVKIQAERNTVTVSHKAVQEMLRTGRKVVVFVKAYGNRRFAFRLDPLPATDVDVDAICRYLRNEDLRPKGKDLLFLERDMEARKIAHRRRKMAR